jgi:uncharacterized membrane protein
MRAGRSRGFGIAAVLGAFALGGTTMYLFDADHGRRRRGRMRDMATHLGREGRDLVGKGSRDLSHRFTGAVAEMSRTLNVSDGQADDEVLLARVRSEIGRVCSHPHALEVKVSDGEITLRGAILEREADEVYRRVAHVRGVRAVDATGLERHTSSERVPALQGTGREVGRRGRRRRRGEWTPASRLVGGAAGTALALSGLGRGGLFGRALMLSGASLLVRAATNAPARRLIGIGKGGVQLHKTLFVDAPVSDVFSFFTQHVRQVKRLPDGRSHWVVEGPAGIPLQWDAEVTRHVENDLFAWKTSDGSPVHHAGVAKFESWGNGTRIDIRVTYEPVAGVVGHALATLLGSNPKRALDEDMLRFKSLLERGKTFAHGELVSKDDLRTMR